MSQQDGADGFVKAVFVFAGVCDFVGFFNTFYEGTEIGF
jgi:hypothetical protein